MEIKNKKEMNAMKKLGLLLFFIGTVFLYGAEKTEKVRNVAEEQLFYMNHDTFRIETGKKVIYTDPFNIPDGAKKADIILITHQHHDHLQLESINKIADKNTVIVAPVTAEYEMKNKVLAMIKRVKPGDKIKVGGINVEVTAAYNVKEERLKFHPKKEGFTGYIINVAGVRIYFAGDTDSIPEMKKIKCDIALLPVSGTYVMTADEAVEAATAINPKIVIPMHYGAIVGSDEDAKKFKILMEGKKIEVLIKEKEIK